ncbi:restriction endonuclease subunit S [Alkalispirochaeta sphaeroplastigenens]|uniref:restriction endonuclease subunit S n=1 Tax=Alkalispirochaeta sphaeroplastigenens TaxID=1187066 RepID=UPI000CDB3589|nr:restriction endonuclease subunit S [Alkalispirochaeta sphaeroplastigenens]
MRWPTQKLEAVADFCLGKMLDQKKNRGEPLPYLANVNVRWGEFNLADLREMRFEQHELDRYSLKYGDIVMCEGGEPGRCAIWKEQCSNMMIQKALHRIRPHDCLRPEFLYYFFLYKGRTGHLASLFTGATIKHLPREKLALVEVPVPPYSAQNQIASILSAYDDLIENNRRRIQLLEQAARLLYKEWFVHLRFPGHEHTQIIDGVPEGWEKKPLGSIASLKYGKALKNDDRIPGPFPVYGSSGIVGTHTKALVPGPTIIVGRKGNVGSVYWSPDDCHPIDTVYFIDSEHCSFFLYYALQQMTFISTDVAVPGLNRDFAHSRSILVADQKMLRLFEETVSPLHQQTELLKRQNTALAKARDLLLPKLMNGDVAV